VRVSHLAALWLASLGLAVSGCQRDRGQPPNVLIAVVDTLRADRLGAYGNPRGLTPFLDSLAARGTVFANAYSTTSWTCPAVASLMTSRYPTQHRVVSFASQLGDDEVTLAETMRPLRYVSGGFSANFRLLSSLGYAQGFDHWEADLKPGAAELSGTELGGQALAWLDRSWNAAAGRPALLYLQYLEPHAPYAPPDPYRSRFRDPGTDAGDDADLNAKLVSMRWHELTKADVQRLESLYDGEVATVDEQLRQLFAELERRHFLDRAIVVVTADHGEEFWEHGGLTHGITLYNECVHVPLIVVAPGQRAGQHVTENVSLVDIAPTLVDLLGLPAEPHFEGRSLAPLLRDGAPASSGGVAPPVILQLEPTGYGLDTREHAAGIVQDSSKLLLRRSGHTEAYDLHADPGEQNANPASLAGAADALARTLETTQTDLARRASSGEHRAPLDEATREKLRALGYHF
jgi:arylsulfatase A-like enzyme